jgi:hypothetical protein
VLGWTLIGVAGAAAPAMSRALTANGRTDYVAAVQVAGDSAGV